MPAIVPDPNVADAAKGPSLSADYAPRKPIGSTTPDSPAPAETPTPCDSLVTEHQRTLNVTRAAVVNMSVGPTRRARLR